MAAAFEVTKFFIIAIAPGFRPDQPVAPGGSQKERVPELPSNS
jgi:hypothetical protein